MPATTSRSVSQLTDDQLLAAIRQLSWERRLERLVLSSYALVLAAVFALAIVGIACIQMYNPHGLPAIMIIGCVVLAVFAGAMVFTLTCVVTFAFVQLVVGRRARVERRELNRRYGNGWPREYIDEVRKEVARPDGPEWMAILTGSCLPHGGNFLIRLHVWHDRPSVLAIHQMTDDRSTDLYTTRLHQAQIMLAESEQLQVVTLFQGLEPQRTELKSMVFDGIPCCLFAAARYLAEPAVLECNLVGITTDQQNHPAVRLAQWLMVAHSAVERAPMIFGACNSATGEFTVGGI